MFHVPLFFLISGYLFRIKENSFGEFLKNSVKSLLIPYVFFNIISSPILWKLQAHDVWLTGMYEFLYAKVMLGQDLHGFLLHYIICVYWLIGF